VHFEANAKFVWFYVPDVTGVDCAEMLLLNQIEPILDWPRTNVGVTAGFEGELKWTPELGPGIAEVKV
jgi:hypothetical protein